MKYENILEKMSKDDLVQIEKDIKEGALLNLIKQRLESMQQSKMCAVCGQGVYENKGFVLMFGPPDLRKRAHFCAIDCMEYFINHIKKVHSDRGEYY